MPLRILILTNMWPTPGRPGSGIFVREQCEALRAARPDLTLEVLRIDGAGGRLEYLRAVPRLRRSLADGYDLVHAHYGLSAAVAASQSRVPVVATFHGSDIYIGWQRALSRFAAHRAAARIFVSERLRQRLGMPGDVIPTAVDVDVFRPHPRAEARGRLGWKPERRVVLFPGSPGNRAKNHPLFVAALAALPPGLRAQTDGVALSGLSRAQVADYLAAADAVLVTSHYEGACIVAKEALACARPVVSVPVGDVPEMIRGIPGCAVAPPSPEALAAELARTLESGGGEGGPERIREAQVDSAGVAHRVLAVYQRVLGAGRLEAAGRAAPGRADSGAAR